MKSQIKIGCRPSKLAVKQAELIQKSLKENFPHLNIIIQTYKSTGDLYQTSTFSKLGKNIFIKTLEEKLLSNEVDLLVHSLKDVTAVIHKDLILCGVCHPESNRDCLILHPKHKLLTSLTDLPFRAKIGTASLRRKAQLLYQRKDLQIQPIRGNIDSRLKKLESENLDAIMLAEAGLNRLNLQQKNQFNLDAINFIPAPNQGLLGLEIRKNDSELEKICQSIILKKESEHARLQMNILHQLNFSCDYPFGSFIEETPTKKTYHYFVSDPTLSQSIKAGIHLQNIPKKDWEKTILKTLKSKIS